MSYFGDNFIWFVGKVEDRKDPLHRGRVRVRCFGIHTENEQLIPTSSLPWAQVMMPPTSSSTLGQGTSPTGLEVGSHVIGFFTDGNSMQQPLVMGSFYGDSDLQATTSHKTYKSSPQYLKKKEIIDNVNSEDESGFINTDNEIPSPKNTASYPMNHVIQTEGGHLFEHDSDKISEYHHSGSHYEINSDGDKIEINNRDKFTVVIQNDTIYIKGNATMLVKGDVNHTVEGNYNLTVKKDYNITVEENLTSKITKTKTETAETSAQTYEKGEITVAGITQTQHVHPQNSGNHFGGGTDTSKPKG